MSSRVGFISLGCPKNLLDTEVMLGHLVEAGYEITPNAEEADYVVINTCSFINDAKQESINEILDVAWLKENGELKGIIVTGCLAERYKDEIFKELPEVDCILGTGSVHEIVDAVKRLENGEGGYQHYGDINEVKLGGDRIVTTGEAFAYLKISEGCDNRCTYCAIPMLRGKFRSREMDEIIAEARELVEMGIKELIVIGQDTTAYGIDLYGKYALAELLRRLADETDVSWLRVMYCYPDKITDELLNEFETNKKLLRYIDIPIQHINDRILKRMNRRGDGALIREVIGKLRKIEGMAIRTTAIVGFPGETKEEFNELCRFIKEVEFDNFGAFPYSREEDTPAYNFKDQIDEQEKQDRYDIIMREQLPICEKQGREWLNKTLTVLCEGYDVVAETYYGRSYKDAPDIDGKVFFTSHKKHTVGDFVEVKITEAYDYDLSGVEI